MPKQSELTSSRDASSKPGRSSSFRLSSASNLSKRIASGILNAHAFGLESIRAYRIHPLCRIPYRDIGPALWAGELSPGSACVGSRSYEYPVHAHSAHLTKSQPPPELLAVGHVPDRRRLLLHACIPTVYCV